MIKNKTVLFIPLICCSCGLDTVQSEPSVDHSQAALSTTKLVWPNAVSSANSDPWLMEHHAQIDQLNPKVIVLHFANTRTVAESARDVDGIVAAMKEASRYHGYLRYRSVHPMLSVPPALLFDVIDIVDMRNGVNGHNVQPPQWPFNDSTYLPRNWSRNRIDYGGFFRQEFAEHYGYRDPEDPSRFLTLCELIDRGEVNEMWIYRDRFRSDSLDDVGNMEVLEMKPFYDEDRNKIADKNMSGCAGNGCFKPSEWQDLALCRDNMRSFRIKNISWNTGLGHRHNFVHSYGHGIEQFGGEKLGENLVRRGDSYLIPTFSKHFDRFSNQDMDETYGREFPSWYAVRGGQGNVLDYQAESQRVDYAFYQGQQWREGNIVPFDPVCGNVHFPPNARGQNDRINPQEYPTSCEGFMRHEGPGGADLLRNYSAASIPDEYYDLFPVPSSDGAFMIYWYQNFLGLNNGATDEDGEPIPNWWVYLYY